ncbi:hypothetical protein G6F51_014401 [Rhizopus arrhizus]|uniref:Uncharacterized protein n=1 Tax=Rhizopus oryzae TaxID=64495 RepID=A0A9P7BYN8_RHIOR|nr:hypothetical protein G6F51_014401 [Rhizopus arrhizus]
MTSGHVGGRMLRLGDAITPVVADEHALEWKRVSGPSPTSPHACRPHPRTEHAGCPERRGPGGSAQPCR